MQKHRLLKFLMLKLMLVEFLELKLRFLEFLKLRFHGRWVGVVSREVGHVKK